MSERMRIEPAALRRLAPELGALGEELHAVFRRLDAKLDAEGDCWGDDATGKAFLTTYGPAAQDTVTAGHHVASAIQDVARRLTRAADRAEASDVRTRRRFS